MTAAIDIRAKVYCSLGPVLSGSISDTYVQGQGLIETRGTVEIASVIRPARGTSVQFSYAKNGYLARVPRSLVVLSCFADPFRKKTTVQIGCKLTQLRDSCSPDANPLSKEEFGEVPCQVYSQATLGVSAGYVVSRIMQEVGLTGTAPSLTNHFSIDEFDISGGYIQTLSDLFVSEGYVGYMDASGQLAYKSTAQLTTGGPVLSETSLIDVGPIGVGQLPGESVKVSFSTRRLKEPDEEEETEETKAKRNWDYEEVLGALQEVSISYTEEDEDGNVEDVVVIRNFTPYSITLTTYDKWDRAVQRLAYEESALADVNNRYATDAYRYFGGPIGSDIESAIPRASLTEWTYKIPAKGGGTTYRVVFSDGLGFTRDSVDIYKGLIRTQTEDELSETAAECVEEDPPEGYEEVLEEVTKTYITEVELAGTLNIDSYTYNPFPDQDDLFVINNLTTLTADVVESKVTVKYSKDNASGITKTTTASQLIYAKTTTGQQDLATYVKGQSEKEEQIDSWIEGVLTVAERLRSQGTEVRIRTEREYGLQRRPSQEERNNSANSKEDPTEQAAEVAWASGSESIACAEYSIPYSPDDKISWSEEAGYTSSPSDAKQKALAFGRIQNRYALGNRDGINIQIPAELMPPTPLSPVYISAEGITGAYITNGVTYTFDPNGIVASADAMAWGIAV